MSLSPRERRARIVAALDAGRELTVEDACRRFGASPATIRRDFLRLHTEGLVDKTWGGVRARGRSFNLMPPYPEREVRQMEAKRRIAARAAELVAEGDVVFIDGGTTTVHLAAPLAAKQIRIITNSLAIAHQADRLRKGKPGAEVYLTGGMLFPDSELLVGPRTLETLRQYQAQWAFLSVGGLDERGATNHEERIAEVEHTMIECAERTVLLADHTKCGVHTMARVCGWEEVDTWVTDAPVGKTPAGRAARKADVRIVEAR